MLHEGRIKPLDTLAREEVKQIYGRETVKLLDASKGNVATETWGPVAALFDWSVRPEFWDDAPFIMVEYVPLKRFILAESIHARLDAVAAKPSTSTADRDALKKLAEDPELTAAAVNAFLAKSSLSGEDRATVTTLAGELSEEHKWLTPNQIAEAQVMDSEGHRHPFKQWFGEVFQKKQKFDSGADTSIRLSEIEKRGYEVGIRLLHFESFRDREVRRRMVEPLLVMPRPNNKEYLQFLGKTYEKARKSGNIDELSLLELDAAKALDTYWNELQIDDRAVPGTDAKFDERFMAWLRGSSAWVPLKVFLDAKPEQLVEAGYPSDKVNAFLQAFKDLDRAEDEKPGEVAEAKTQALVAAARSLGESVNSTMYPTVEMVSRETYFNESSPFWKAWIVYFGATVLLLISLVFQGFERNSFLGVLAKVFYVPGILALILGVALESQGFYLRVLISGWAPVTNMYETVIWVSAVAAVLGIVLEAIYRKTYAGLAGAGTALLGTLLAAYVPLLDPNIKQLQPVLRSNYWLTIHVLTEVSSYGAFLMAAILGLIATVYYLFATYRRSPSFTELALPLIPGMPLLAVGSVGVLGSMGLLGAQWVVTDNLFYLSQVMAGVGGVLTIIAVTSIAGEVVNRLTFREEAAGLEADAVTNQLEEVASTNGHAASRSAVAVGSEGSGGGTATATLTRPSVREIREMAAGGPKPPLDARGLAMQATAAKIKPLANTIYRTMQVGVLLIAAGTILGGVWADYSWGRFWGWDPKEVWALITLLVYLVPLHGRFAGWINTYMLVLCSVVCSMSVIMAWYGVNFVLGVGLHSYGFVEGGGQGVVTSVCLAVVALPLAAGWRRHLGSRRLIADAA
ncbi:MAG: cytochrome c biogenesis protein CcsA [Isosphaeraceae bacterium]